MVSLIAPSLYLKTKKDVALNKKCFDVIKQKNKKPVLVEMEARNGTSRDLTQGGAISHKADRSQA